MNKKLKSRVDQYMDDAKIFVETPVIPLHEKETTDPTPKTEIEVHRETVIRNQAKLDKAVFEVVKLWHDVQTSLNDFNESIKRDIEFKNQQKLDL